MCMEAHTKKNVWSKICQNINRDEKTGDFHLKFLFVGCVLSKKFVLSNQAKLNW